MRKKLNQDFIAPGTWSRIVVPVSGGKDSQVCLALAVDAVGPDRVLGVHQHTGFDHPLTYEHMDYMRARYEVPILDVKNPNYETVPDVMMTEVMLPSRHARLCTRLLKTDPWFRWLREQSDADQMLVLLGMRAAESVDRRKNYGDLVATDLHTMGEISSESPKKTAAVKVQLPIVNWTTPQVFEFLRHRGDKINPLYAKGHKRVGCFPCVLAGKGSMELTVRDPIGRQNIEQLSDAIHVIQWARPELDISGFFDHDLPTLLAKKTADPFGFMEEDEQTAGGCSWCQL